MNRFQENSLLMFKYFKASVTDTMTFLLNFFHLKYHMFNLNCGRHINFTRATDEPQAPTFFT